MFFLGGGVPITRIIYLCSGATFLGNPHMDVSGLGSGAQGELVKQKQKKPLLP